MTVSKMIRSFFFILVFELLNSSIAVCQKVYVSKDSSRLIFPNHVEVGFSKKIKKGVSVFEFSKPALQTLQVQWNFVYGSLEVNLEKNRLLENEIIILDSARQTLEAQLKIADERLLVYSSGYENVKAIASGYDTQVKALIVELEMIRKNEHKAKRKTFSKGVVAGFICGIAITSFVVVRRN